MNQQQKPPDKPQSAPTVQPAAWLIVGGEVAGITLFIVFVAVFGGIALDKLLGTKPILTILFVLGSAPLALILTYLVAMRAVKTYTPTGTSTPGQPAYKYDEEDKSE
jgi:hypothetical protein